MNAIIDEQAAAVVGGVAIEIEADQNEWRRWKC